MGHARELLKSVLIIVVVVGLTGAIAKADSISVISGTLGTSSYVNVSGTISAGDGTVTIALSNNLTNSQVISIGQNISGIYFQVWLQRSALTYVQQQLRFHKHFERNGYLTRWRQPHWLDFGQFWRILVRVRDLSARQCAGRTWTYDRWRDWFGGVRECEWFDRQQRAAQSTSGWACYIHAIGPGRHGRLPVQQCNCSVRHPGHSSCSGAGRRIIANDGARRGHNFGRNRQSVPSHLRTKHSSWECAVSNT
jgi:hypothetical protein